MRILLIKDEDISEHTIDDETRIDEIDRLIGAKATRAAPLTLSLSTICIWSVDAEEMNGLASKLTGHLVYGAAVIAEINGTRIVGLRQDFIDEIKREA